MSGGVILLTAALLHGGSSWSSVVFDGLTGICGIRAEYRKMRNVWTLRNNWEKRNTRPNGIPGLMEYTEDCGKLFTPPVARRPGNYQFNRIAEGYGCMALQTTCKHVSHL